MAKGKKLHVVLFPWLAFGHMTPFLQLAKSVAAKGHRVSFISTPRNVDRLPKIPPHLASSITLVKIPLPRIPELPENAEATMDIPTEDIQYLKKAFDGLEAELTRFLEDSSPDWILYDFAPHWLPPIAARLGISRAFLCMNTAWFLSFFGPPDGSDGRSRPEDFMVPPKWVRFQTKVAYRKYEAQWIVGSVGESDASGFSDGHRGSMVIAGSEVILLRYCNEFEARWLKLLEELQQKPVIPMGLMPPQVQGINKDLGNDEAWPTIKNWLDSHEISSVVYVALGTEVMPSQDQLTELALGLELSGVPFFWTLRDFKSRDSHSLKLPEGLEERVKDRAIVWKSWAPQLEILSHDSVGGFLTHCGWSSFIEGLSFGHPLIALPFLVDQGLNARIIAENQLGVEIPRNELDGSYTRNSVADSVKLVMSETDGKMLKAKAREISAVFGKKEVHQQYVENVLEFLENRRL